MNLTREYERAYPVPKVMFKEILNLLYAFGAGANCGLLFFRNRGLLQSGTTDQGREHDCK